MPNPKRERWSKTMNTFRKITLLVAFCIGAALIFMLPGVARAYPPVWEQSKCNEGWYFTDNHLGTAARDVVQNDACHLYCSNKHGNAIYSVDDLSYSTSWTWVELGWLWPKADGSPFWYADTVCADGHEWFQVIANCFTPTNRGGPHNLRIETIGEVVGPNIYHWDCRIDGNWVTHVNVDTYWSTSAISAEKWDPKETNWSDWWNLEVKGIPSASPYFGPDDLTSWLPWTHNPRWEGTSRTGRQHSNDDWYIYTPQSEYLHSPPLANTSGKVRPRQYYRGPSSEWHTPEPPRGDGTWFGKAAFTSAKCIMFGDYGTGGVDIAARNNDVYVVANPHVPGMNGLWFRKSTDYGATWHDWVRIHEPNGWFNLNDPQITTGSSPNVLYAACEGSYSTSSDGSDISVFRSDNYGDTWSLYYRAAGHTQGGIRWDYIDPSLSSNGGRVMLSYTERQYWNGGFHGTEILAYQLEPRDAYYGWVGSVSFNSANDWNGYSRCAVAADGSCWFTWKQGNVWDGDIAISHFSSQRSYVWGYDYLARSASHPDVGVSASGVVNVVYNRWDGQNHWACVRGTSDGYNWWGEELLQQPDHAGGGGNNHCPRTCQNSTDTSEQNLLGWAVYRTAWNGDFSSATFRWGGEGCHEFGTTMNLQSAGGFNPLIEDYQTFDVCTNGNYHYMVAENSNGSIWVKRNDFKPPQCDSVMTSSSSGGTYGGTLYTNSNFNVSYNNVRDDWDVTPYQYYDIDPPCNWGGDFYNRGVTQLDAYLNGSWAAGLTDDPDRDGNWVAPVDISGRPDGNYTVGGGPFWDTAGNMANLPISTVVVDRVNPTCKGGILINGKPSSGTTPSYVSSNFNLGFSNPLDNLDITSSGNYTNGVKSIQVKYRKNGETDWHDLALIQAGPDWSATVSLASLAGYGTYYFKGDIKDVASNIASGDTADNPSSGPVVVSPQPTVTSIVPNSGKKGTTVNVSNLTGTGFLPGAEVRLEQGGTTIGATNVVVVSATKITCSFNLTDPQGQPARPTGWYAVVVKNSDGQEGKLTPQGFQVNSPSTGTCGTGAGASLPLFGALMGLLSLTSSIRFRKPLRWWRRKKNSKLLAQDVWLNSIVHIGDSCRERMGVMRTLRAVCLKRCRLICLLMFLLLIFIVGCSMSNTAERGTPAQRQSAQDNTIGPVTVGSPGVAGYWPTTTQEADQQLQDWLSANADEVYSASAPKTKEEKTAKIEEAERVGAPKAEADLDRKFNQVLNQQTEQYKNYVTDKKHSSKDLKEATEYISKFRKVRMPKIKLPKSDWLGAPTGIYNVKGDTNLVRRITPIDGKGDVSVVTYRDGITLSYQVSSAKKDYKQWVATQNENEKSDSGTHTSPSQVVSVHGFEGYGSEPGYDEFAELGRHNRSAYLEWADDNAVYTLRPNLADQTVTLSQLIEVAESIYK